MYPKTWLEETREAWAEQTNQALERAGHAIQIDHRSLEAQGIERLPSLHLGPTVAAMEARGIETERGAVQELSVEVATWETELAAWPPAVGESVGRALETAAERAEERSRSETARWRTAMQAELTRLTELTAKQGQQNAALGRLIGRQEQVLVPWWLSWIREEWRALILPLVVGLVVGGGVTTLYQRFGPPAQELTTYRGMWEAMTAAEKARINKRIRGEAADK